MTKASRKPSKKPSLRKTVKVRAERLHTSTPAPNYIPKYFDGTVWIADTIFDRRFALFEGNSSDGRAARFLLHEELVLKMGRVLFPPGTEPVPDSIKYDGPADGQELNKCPDLIEVVKAPHYNDTEYETIDVIEDGLGRDGMIAWLRGELYKYNARFGKKGSEAEMLKDAGKVRFYSTLLEAVLTGRTISTTGLRARANVVFDTHHPARIAMSPTKSLKE